jgi:hypothetical protein
MLILIGERLLAGKFAVRVAPSPSADPAVWLDEDNGNNVKLQDVDQG